jgi:hypothetical protein
MSSQFLLVHDNGHTEALADSGAVQAGIFTLARLSQSRTDALGRTIRNLNEVALARFDAYLQGVDGDLRAEVKAMRRDDFAASLGAGINPRDLTHKMRRVLEERLPPLNATRIFPISTEIPPGMMSYEQSRTYSTGEAVVYRGGTGADVPLVGLGAATVKHPVVYLLSKAAINWLEQLATNQLGLDTQARKMRAARRAIDELVNKWAFNGSQAHGLFGLLNHPYVDTALSAVSYIDATDADDIAADFGVWANYADNESGSTFGANCLQIAPKLANYLRNRAYGDNRDKSLMDWMLGANPHITKVELVRELNDAGGTGIHAMAFCRIGGGPLDSSLQLEVPMTPTMLPPDRKALATEMYLVSAYAGLNQTEAGDNLVVYVQGT